MKPRAGQRQLSGLLVAALIGLCTALAVAVPARAATANVDEVGTLFQPTPVQVMVNDRVVWTNRSTSGHTVTFDGGPDLNPSCDPATPSLLRVGCQAPGSTVQRTFTAPGRYTYHCKIHASQGMTGVVVVVAATTTTTAPSSTTATVKTSTTTRATSTSSTTATTRQLATSSTVFRSSTTTSDTSSALLPGAPPPFSDGTGSNASGTSGGRHNGADTGTVALIVGLLLAVSAGGGYLLWRLRPGRA